MDLFSLEVGRAARRLLKSPAFLLPTTATLALGIGAAVAIFTLVNAVLLEPLPYSDAERLVALRHSAPGLGVASGGISEGIYLHYREHARVFESIGVYVQHDAVTATDGDDAERLRIALVTPSVFEALRVSAAKGRLFTTAEGLPGAPTVVVISHDLWVRRYGADSNIVGRRIELNHLPFEVVGVMPRGFSFPRHDTQVWYNLSINPARATVRDFHLGGVGRLKSGVSRAEAELALQQLMPSLAGEFADATPDVVSDGQLRPRVVPLKDTVVGDVREPLLILLCTALFVLVIACANVTSLVLVRTERYRRDVAVERALGATTLDIGWRFLSEHILLAILGGCAGVAVAYAGIASQFGFEPGQLPRLREVRLDTSVIIYGLTASFGIGALLGAVAYLRAGRAQLGPMLKEATSRMTAGRQWQHALRILVALQIALALTLLIGSALMVQSLWRMERADLGFAPSPALTFELSLPYDPYPTYSASARFYSRLVDQLRQLPGVTAAEAVGVLPLVPIPAYLRQPVALAGLPETLDQVPPAAAINFATPGYFRAMHIPFTDGRTFAPGDLAAAANPVVISSVLARQLMGERNPLGQRIRFPDFPGYPAHTIVGVVGGVAGERIADGQVPALYFPVLDDGPGAEQRDAARLYLPGEMAVVVQSNIPMTTLIPAVRATVRHLDPRVPLARIRSMDQIVASSTARTRLTALLLLVAAGTASFLSVIGIYGVVAYTVSQRVPEFGVRLALGARPMDLRRAAMRQGVYPAIVGTLLGLGTAFALSRFLRSLLFSVRPGDPLTFVAVPALLIIVAMVASYTPARRAARIAPVEALKTE